ncbi:MAG: hypothetical protein HDS16_01415 [Bacteroides sp.]|nr:hypothetical protein [Bacteroides sp.]
MIIEKTKKGGSVTPRPQSQDSLTLQNTKIIEISEIEVKNAKNNDCTPRKSTKTGKKSEKSKKIKKTFRKIWKYKK